MSLKKFLSSAAAFLLAALCLFSGCATKKDGGHSYFVQLSVERSGLYVDGENLSASEYDALMRELEALVNGLEDAFSVQIEESDIARINRAAAGETVAIQDDTAALMRLAVQYTAFTGGKFSPALFPLTELWGFAPADAEHFFTPRPEPSASEIARARALSDISLLNMSQEGISKAQSGAKLDLGGIAKGYIADRVSDHILQKYDARTVDGIVGISTSNTVLLGKKREGNVTRGYNVGIDNPRALTSGIGTALYMVGLSDMSVTTSADNYRYYAEGGKIRPHIIDPATGKPADRGIISVTIAVPNGYPDAGAFADALSTACFCMPLTEALAFCRELSGQGIGAVIITADHKFYYVGVNAMGRRDYAEYSNRYLGTEYDLDLIEEVFEEGDPRTAADTIVPCEAEQIYIEKAESLARKS